MLYLDKIIEQTTKKVDVLRVEGTSSKFDRLSDHSYIVGKIDGMMEVINDINKMIKETEDEYEYNAR